MIKVFNSIDKAFATNGDVVIIPTKAIVHKEDNGAYYLDLECGLEYIDFIKADNIIVADTPTGEQAFRITNPQTNRKKITARCNHVFFDSKNLLIEDSYVVEKNCNYALNYLNEATSDPSPFTTISNIESIKSYRCVRTSLHDAIKIILDRWGGHLVRDNFLIKIMDKIGTDNGVIIRYAKNLKEITYEENWDDVVTKLMPVGKDGLLLESKYVYSDIQYDIPYTKTVSFSQEINQDDYVTEEEYQQALVDDLNTQAQKYVNSHSVPKINYTLKANLEKLTDIGDIIEVVDERLGINITTNVIAFDYDCILKQYKEVEFGNFQKKLSGLVDTINAATDKTILEATNNLHITLNKELQEASEKIWGALGNSYVIYEGDKILIVDRLPKEAAVNVIMINNGGIGFSNTGINGTFNSAWTIDNVLNMEQINVINLTANLIKGGTLKLGSNLNEYGQLEIYDEANNLIGEMNKNGLKMYGIDGSYVLLNNEVGFAGFDRLGNKIYWVNKDEFHMKKSVVEEEITLCNKMRFIPITLTDGNNNITNDGIGLVSFIAGGDS